MNNGRQMGQALRSITSIFDKASTSTSHQQTHLKSELTNRCGPGALTTDGGMVLPDDGPSASFVCCFNSLVSSKHQVQFVFLCKLFRLWILYPAPFILLSEEGVDVLFFLRNMVAAKQKGSKSGQGPCLMHF